MTFKTVFMAVGAGQEDAELDRGVAIARALDAHLEVLVLGIAPPPPASPYGVVSNDLWAGEIREGQDEAQTRAEALQAKLAGVGDLRCQIEAQFIAQCAVYAREKGAMKDMPALLLAALSTKSAALVKPIVGRQVRSTGSFERQPLSAMGWSACATP